MKRAVEAKTPEGAALMENTFFNEIHFYQNIWKAFDKFQRRFPQMKPFDKIPKFYYASGDCHIQKLVMENLKYSGYRTFPRGEAFSDDQLAYILTEYGRFHGLSTAFRKHNPEEYKLLVDPLKDSTTNVVEMRVMKGYVLICMNRLISMVKNEAIKQKLGKYGTEAIQIVLNSLKYKGKNPVLNHGDCWSNNIMVKYEVSFYLYGELLQRNACRCFEVTCMIH